MNLRELLNFPHCFELSIETILQLSPMHAENVTLTYNVIHSYGNNVRNEEARKSGGRASVKLDSLWSAASETNTLETSLQKTSYRVTTLKQYYYLRIINWNTK